MAAEIPPSTSTWLLSRTAIPVLGEAVARHFGVDKAITWGGLGSFVDSYLPDSVKIFGARAQDVFPDPSVAAETASKVAEATTGWFSSIGAFFSNAGAKVVSFVPDVIVPKLSWVTTPGNAVWSRIGWVGESVWAYVPNCPSWLGMPGLATTIVDYAKGFGTCAIEIIRPNMDWAGPIAAVAGTSAAANWALSGKIENSTVRYAVSTGLGTVSIWGASQLAAWALGTEPMAFRATADLALRVTVYGLGANVVSKICPVVISVSEAVAERLGDRLNFVSPKW